MDLKGDLNIEKKITMKNREMERAFRKKKTRNKEKNTRGQVGYTPQMAQVSAGVGKRWWYICLMKEETDS